MPLEGGVLPSFASLFFGGVCLREYQRLPLLEKKGRQQLSKLHVLKSI